MMIIIKLCTQPSCVEGNKLYSKGSGGISTQDPRLFPCHFILTSKSPETNIVSIMILLFYYSVLHSICRRFNAGSSLGLHLSSSFCRYISFHTFIIIDLHDAFGIATRLQYGRYGGSNPVTEHRFFYSALYLHKYGTRTASCSMGTGVLSRVKRSELKINHYPSSSASVQNERSYTSTPLYSFVALNETLFFNLYFYIIFSNSFSQSLNKSFLLSV